MPGMNITLDQARTGISPQEQANPTQGTSTPTGSEYYNMYSKMLQASNGQPNYGTGKAPTAQPYHGAIILHNPAQQAIDAKTGMPNIASSINPLNAVRDLWHGMFGQKNGQVQQDQLQQKEYGNALRNYLTSKDEKANPPPTLESVLQNIVQSNDKLGAQQLAQSPGANSPLGQYLKANQGKLDQANVGYMQSSLPLALLQGLAEAARYQTIYNNQNMLGNVLQQFPGLQNVTNGVLMGLNNPASTTTMGKQFGNMGASSTPPPSVSGALSPPGASSGGA